VGAGLGGLATALRLAHRGHKVTILEKTDAIGGRNRVIRVNECVFDAGPTLLMMLDPFVKLFRDVGERFEDHLQITLCDPNYRTFFADGNRIDCTTNVAKMIRQIEALSGPKDAAEYPQMLGKLADLYHSSVPNFVRRNYDSPLDLAKLNSAKIALKHGMLGNLAKGMERFFDDPRLRNLFCLQTMYLGLSPYDAPWVYAVLVYMEYGEGIWYPNGGMAEICQAVGKLAEIRGVEIRLNSPDEGIEGKSVRLESGETLAANAVICNADLPYADRSLTLTLDKRSGRALRHSCSAFTIYMDYEGELPDVLHHNIVLGKDFSGNLDQIFNQHIIPDDPAFYMASSSKTDRTKAPHGHENLQLLVPCPNLDHPWTDNDAKTLKERVFTRLEQEVGFDRTQIRGMKTLTPLDWKSMLNLDKGAAFGLSHDFMQSVCFRPSNKSKTCPGLYYVGASTVPGNGLPMVLISAELVEQRLLADGLI